MDISPLLSAVLSFIFVLGLLLATLWFVRTRGIGMGAMQGKTLRVVNSLRLGPTHRLDVVEFEGLRSVYAPVSGDKKQYVALGTVKSQVGHTKAAAGSDADAGEAEGEGADSDAAKER